MIQSLKCFFHWRRTHKMAFSSFQFLILNNYWNRSSIIGMINNLCFLNFFSGKDRSPVHVVLVSLLVDQLSGLFLTFLGRPKIKLFSLREFLVSLWIFFGQALIFWYTKKKFWYTKKKFGRPKKSEPDQKFPETEQIFFGRPKKGRNRLYNWSTKRLTKTTWTGLMALTTDLFTYLSYDMPKVSW